MGQAAELVSELRYEYDFGDGWQHDVRIERVLPSVGPDTPDTPDTPRLVAGARACPPEDCGGCGGYAKLLEVLADPSHEEHDRTLHWVGGEFDPEAFDLNATNANLELVDRHTRQRGRGA